MSLAEIMLLVAAALVSGLLIGLLTGFRWGRRRADLPETATEAVDCARRTLRLVASFLRLPGASELIDPSRWDDLRRQLYEVMCLGRRRCPPASGDPTVSLRRPASRRRNGTEKG